MNIEWQGYKEIKSYYHFDMKTVLLIFVVVASIIVGVFIRIGFINAKKDRDEKAKNDYHSSDHNGSTVDH